MAITLDITEIKKILPHRFPMLLVDRILDLDTDRSHGAGRWGRHVVSAGKPGQDCRICQD